MKETLVKFINKNFDEASSLHLFSGSELNGAFTILCGYADNIGASQENIKQAIKEVTGMDLNKTQRKELGRVFDFASTYHYGRWWSTTEAKSMYKF